MNIDLSDVSLTGDGTGGVIEIEVALDRFHAEHGTTPDSIVVSSLQAITDAVFGKMDPTAFSVSAQSICPLVTAYRYQPSSGQPKIVAVKEKHQA